MLGWAAKIGSPNIASSFTISHSEVLTWGFRAPCMLGTPSALCLALASRSSVLLTRAIWGKGQDGPPCNRCCRHPALFPPWVGSGCLPLANICISLPNGFLETVHHPSACVPGGITPTPQTPPQPVTNGSKCTKSPDP